ncbi:MAG: peptidoglycan DD-metalloendopeptidase family protein [Phenylobacterium sp.]|uniref:peptidoglycan DD-metalloendopeptidase family protein n=1 Tax=Phenylobacterium sp. TaxID=1871053 RepID=UPI002736447A|nr:peptidoglycan DD-metalloendopeptidase family protein [Phenylobacterium sp.]MDP3174985.1 peptidoglycan DD-metalloendopeptidase family protein [Phenylobacterium sp.]
MTRLARLRQSLEELFPERHLYVRSGGEMRAFVLSPNKQMGGAAAIAAAALWMGVSTTALFIGAISPSSADQEAARVQAKYERWIADRQARLNSAVAQLNAADGSINGIAMEVEKRHTALALLLTDVKGAPGAAEALAPAINRALAAPNANPLRRVEMVRLSQERLLDAAETFAKGRAQRLRLAFRLAGLSPANYVRESGSLGGPLIEAKDPRALAAILDVDESFAERVQQAAKGLSEVRTLSAAAETLPFSRPTEGTPQTSGFGVRFDPFTGRPAFHSGLDFAGATMTPIQATGPGVVSFTGPRAGYGNAIEIDHGRGLKTRYAHLQSIGVRVGQKVAVGQRIGGMGSTGRSTGTHLHYEVWVNGRPQNPDRFVKAGRYVHENNS